MIPIEQLLHAASNGDRQAAAELMPLVYEELRRLAAVRLAQEQSGQTLQPTALVHEVYLRLVGTENSLQWDSKPHFFAAAAEAMRRILIENARRKRGTKHGGDHERRDLNPALLASQTQHDELLALDEAIDQLAVVDSRAAEVVKLRFFSGLTLNEIALALGVSARTVDADWAYARAWLIDNVRGGS